MTINQKTYKEMISRWENNNPNPKSDLNWTNDYTFCVAVILSAQSTDIGVNKATSELFKIADSAGKMLNLGEENLKKHIKTIGLYNNKAKNIILMSQQLLDRFEGQIPTNPDDLESLPGIGRKTANVISNILFGAKRIGVDTHVIRLSHRLKLIPEITGENPIKIEEALIKITPDEYMNRIGNWIVLHGRYLCKAQKPLCEKCFLYDICPADCKRKID